VESMLAASLERRRPTRAGVGRPSAVTASTSDTEPGVPDSTTSPSSGRDQPRPLDKRSDISEVHKRPQLRRNLNATTHSPILTARSGRPVNRSEGRSRVLARVSMGTPARVSDSSIVSGSS
jgi:hypothetical protein